MPWMWIIPTKRVPKRKCIRLEIRQKPRAFARGFD